MRNTVADLNNYLFEQLERLQDDDLTEEELKKEVIRADSVTKVANSIINAGKISIQAAKLQAEYGDSAAIPLTLVLTDKKKGSKNGR